MATTRFKSGCHGNISYAYMHVYCTVVHKYYAIDIFKIIALAIFSRSPAAYHAVRSLGIFQLPCDKTVRGYMYKHASSPGIQEDGLLDRAKRYDAYKVVSRDL